MKFLVEYAARFESFDEFKDELDTTIEFIEANFLAIKAFPQNHKRKRIDIALANGPARPHAHGPAPVPALAPAPILLVHGPVLAPGSGAVGQFIQEIENSTRYVQKITS
jgi:hypothetical protein